MRSVAPVYIWIIVVLLIRYAIIPAAIKCVKYVAARKRKARSYEESEIGRYEEFLKTLRGKS